MSLLDVIQEHETYNAKAAAESRNHPCDLCRTAEGESFTDYYWTCGECRRSYIRRIVAEAYGKADLIVAVAAIAAAMEIAA